LNYVATFYLWGFSYNRNAELTQWALSVNHYSEVLCITFVAKKLLDDFLRSFVGISYISITTSSLRIHILEEIMDHSAFL